MGLEVVRAVLVVPQVEGRAEAELDRPLGLVVSGSELDGHDQRALDVRLLERELIGYKTSM